MKPFNLKAALEGAPVVTRDGRPATCVTLFRKEGEHLHHPVLAIVGDRVVGYTLEGGYTGTMALPLDLFMASRKTTLWIVLWKYRSRNQPKTPYSHAFETESEALDWQLHRPSLQYFSETPLSVTFEE